MILLRLKRNPKPISFLFQFNLLHSKTLNPPQEPASNFITQYLIDSCGFSPEKAAKHSRPIAYLSSPHRPDSVRHFFKHLGFTDAQLRSLITGYPTILACDVGGTLKPNFDKLRSLGFPDTDLRRVIAANPRALIMESAVSVIDFWAALLQNEKRLVAVLRRNRGLVNHDIDRVILPKIALLKEHGLSEAEIGMIAVRGQRFITRSIESMEEVLRRAKELGFASESPMFGLAVSSLSSIGSVRLKEKMEFFEGYGWSQEEFLLAMKKAPFFIHLNEVNVREKMEFLVGRVGYEKSCIVSNPLLLMFSLEKRLKPRYCVMELLKLNGLDGKWTFSSMVRLPEKRFVDQVLLCYKEKLPKVEEIYAAAFAG